MKNSFSNNGINKLGAKIRTEYGNLKPETLQTLQDYRTSHKDSLSSIFNILLAIRKEVSKSSIVTYRIKRFESIIGKLIRYEKMNLSRMWDIGGCRVIFNSDKEVYKFKAEVSKQLTIRKEYDYLAEPQKDGYKSLHLFVESPIDNKVIEIQIRNQQDHNWATLVEISDLLFESKLKEYGKDKKLLRFHLLLSKENLTILEKKEIAKTIKEYKYLDKLNSVFTRNYLNVRLQWLLIENEYRHKFFLIETSKNNVPIIEAFDNFADAELGYFKKFKDNNNANVVLTYLLKPTFDQISIAYSNYMLTMHSCLDDFTIIFESLIVESLKANRYFDFLKYFGQYQDISISKYANLYKETKYTEKINQKLLATLDKRKRNKIDKKIRKKEKEWKLQINNNLKASNSKFKEFRDTFQQNYPRGKTQGFIIKQIVRYSSVKYGRKYERLLK